MKRPLLNRSVFFLALAACGAGAFALVERASAVRPADPVGVTHDWPQWGGTQCRNMCSDEINLPNAWDPGPRDKNTEEYDTTKSKNLKWIATLGSQMHGNPTVSGGKVFVGTNNTSPRNPNRKDDAGVLMCFNEADGKFLWQLTVPKLKAGKVNDWEYIGLTSSPTVDGDRVYCVTNRCELLCLGVDGVAKGNRGPFKNEGQYVVDPDKLRCDKPDEFAGTPADISGADIIWRLDMIERLGVFPHNATHCSVLVDGEKVICGTSNGVDWGHDTIRAPDAPTVICVNKLSGEVIWTDDIGMGRGKRSDCGLRRAIFHSNWSSPSLAVVNGKKQILFGGGDGYCYALDAENGKTIWKADCVLSTQKKNAKGFILYPDYKGPSEIMATPVFYKNRVYVAVGQDPDHGEGLGVLTCLDATMTGDTTQNGKIWFFDKINRSISTCSIYNDLLFVCDIAGNVYCLDPDTGKLHWRFDSGAHIWGSTLAADGKIYFGNDDGDFTVLSARNTLEEISNVNLGDSILSTPVVANGTMYIATQTHLFAIAKK
ncbi:MAG TPA: PQQ-binding-like beta-propeller repeat protein [Planctomycetota bacterium]|nr:PQQ-binding-like beta-propeller repeat protein [Planctomycetota bacterium]